MDVVSLNDNVVYVVVMVDELAQTHLRDKDSSDEASGSSISMEQVSCDDAMSKKDSKDTNFREQIFKCQRNDKGSRIQEQKAKIQENDD